MVADTRLPPASVTATSPSSASASSAVTTRPDFQTKPDDSARGERTETIEVATGVTRPESEAERAVSSVRSGVAGIGISLGADPNVRMPAAVAYCPCGQAKETQSRSATSILLVLHLFRTGDCSAGPLGR